MDFGRSSIDGRDPAVGSLPLHAQKHPVMNRPIPAAEQPQRSKLSEYLRTVLFYCGDILKDSIEIEPMAPENNRLEQTIRGLQALDLYDAPHARTLESAMNGFHKKLSALYFRYPDNAFIERLFVRSGNLRDMCAQCSSGFSGLEVKEAEAGERHEIE